MSKLSTVPASPTHLPLGIYLYPHPRVTAHVPLLARPEQLTLHLTLQSSVAYPNTS